MRISRSAWVAAALTLAACGTSEFIDANVQSNVEADDGTECASGGTRGQLDARSGGNAGGVEARGGGFFTSQPLATCSPGPSSTANSLANHGWKVAHQVQFDPKKSDTLGLTGSLLLGLRSGYTLGVSCQSMFWVVAPDESKTEAASANECICESLEVLPVRNQMVGTATADGTHTAILRVASTRTQFGDGSAILVEAYRGS